MKFLSNIGLFSQRSMIRHSLVARSSRLSATSEMMSGLEPVSTACCQPRDLARPVTARGGTLLLILILISSSCVADDQDWSRQRSRIETAVAAGTKFLLSQQQNDGVWRSQTYGLLKEGTSLTPLVLSSLPITSATEQARQRGLDAMASWIDFLGNTSRFRTTPQSPVYAAGLSLRLLKKSESPQKEAIATAWRDLLLAHQLAEVNHWPVDDPRFGGWGYSHEPPRRPDDPDTLSPLSEPNLSATVIALEGLTTLPDDARTEAARANAVAFVRGCQNWHSLAADSDQAFDDGGFYFALDDEVRNKAGVAGTDSTGQRRFVSYGSATADGLRALIYCGLPVGHPRVTAARRWLVDHFGDGSHLGNYPADRAQLKPSLDYYYAASVAHALRVARTEESPRDAQHWAMILSARLIQKQHSEGWWANPAVDVREDDPLIATSFALVALELCHQELSRGPVQSK